MFLLESSEQLPLELFSNEVYTPIFTLCLHFKILALSIWVFLPGAISVLTMATISQICITGSWDDVFKVAIALYIIGTLVWNFFATGEKILD